MKVNTCVVCVNHLDTVIFALNQLEKLTLNQLLFSNHPIKHIISKTTLELLIFNSKLDWASKATGLY